MTANQHHGAHSAQIEMTLVLENGERISITHMAADYLLIEPVGEHPSGEATIFLQIDQSESHWNVHLPDGIQEGQRRIRIANS